MTYCSCGDDSREAHTGPDRGWCDCFEEGCCIRDDGKRCRCPCTFCRENRLLELSLRIAADATDNREDEEPSR